MKYSPKQYAESLYEMTTKDQIKKFAEFLYKNGDSALLSDIAYHFTNIWKEKNGQGPHPSLTGRDDF